MIKVIESSIQGCFEIQNRRFEDERGLFVKTFHQPTFEKLGLHTDFPEEYYSTSKKGVIRGMHFQLPPYDHVKMVYCTSGAVMDVVVDLRKGSATFGTHAVFELSSKKANMVYIPKGMAHGFCALEDDTMMHYKQSTVYAPDHDAGILWSSVGVDWAVEKPILSARDMRFDAFDMFDSPFSVEVIHE